MMRAAGLSTSDSLSRLLQSFGIAAFVVLIYWAGLDGGFLFDDFPNIVTNTRVHVQKLAWSDWLSAAMSSPAADLPRPLAMVSFAANHYFTGLDPGPMKLTNVLLHACNSALVFWLCFQLVNLLPEPGRARARLVPLVVAVAWSLHPINLSAVLLIVQRMEVLSHSFVLIGLLLYVSGRRAQIAGHPGWLPIVGGLVGCTALGLSSKESAALTPLYALAIEWSILDFRARQQTTSKALKRFFILIVCLPAVLGLVWLAPRSLFEGAYTGRDFTLTERLLTEARVAWSYASWILLPDLGKLSLNHDDFVVSRGLLQPPSTFLALLGIPAYLIAAWRLRPNVPLAALGMMWFASAHLLTGTIVPLELVFEHRNYFASLGLLLGLVASLASSTLRGRRRLGLSLAVLLTCFYATATSLRAKEWGDPITLSRTEALKRPLSPRAAYDWGRTLVIISRYEPSSPAAQEALKALERARAIPGSTILPNHALIILASRTGIRMEPDWWSDMEEKLRDHPIGPQEKAALAALVACTNSGSCRLPRREMSRLFHAALQRGEDAEILNIYASYVWGQLRDAAMATELWSRAISANPSEAQYRINLTKLLIFLGRRADAEQQILALRGLGEVGQFRAQAAELERQLPQAPAPTGHRRQGK
jgi:protein O-mannosyl-transferase